MSGVFSDAPSSLRSLPPVPKHNEDLMQDGKLADNFTKNRYRDVIPYDSTRVKLQPTEASPGDYINASFVPVWLTMSFTYLYVSDRVSCVQGYYKKVEYIVTQGPLVSTVDAFWSMVWQQNSRVIVMIAKTVEDGREKSAHVCSTLVLHFTLC